MSKDEAFDVMSDTYEELPYSVTLNVPLDSLPAAVFEDAWYYYCNGIMPTGLLRKALVKALRDAE